MQLAVCGGSLDRVHDLLLCGLDPSHACSLDKCVAFLQRREADMLIQRNARQSFFIKKRKDDVLIEDHHKDMVGILRFSGHCWATSRHAYMYGPQFQACITSVSSVQV